MSTQQKEHKQHHQPLSYEVSLTLTCFLGFYFIIFSLICGYSFTFPLFSCSVCQRSVITVLCKNLPVTYWSELLSLTPHFLTRCHFVFILWYLLNREKTAQWVKWKVNSWSHRIWFPTDRNFSFHCLRFTKVSCSVGLEASWSAGKSVRLYHCSLRRESNGKRMVNDEILKDMEGSRFGKFEVLSHHFPLESPKLHPCVYEVSKSF